MLYNRYICRQLYVRPTPCGHLDIPCKLIALGTSGLVMRCDWFFLFALDKGVFMPRETREGHGAARYDVCIRESITNTPKKLNFYRCFRSGPAAPAATSLGPRLLGSHPRRALLSFKDRATRVKNNFFHDMIFSFS